MSIKSQFKTNKPSDHIVIKHINAQRLIPKLDEIKLLIENEDQVKPGFNQTF